MWGTGSLTSKTMASSQVRSPRSSRISRFIRAGEMRCRQARSQQKFSANMESRLINSHRLLVTTFPSMSLLKRNVHPVLNRTPAQ